MLTFSFLKKLQSSWHTLHQSNNAQFSEYIETLNVFYACIKTIDSISALPLQWIWLVFYNVHVLIVVKSFIRPRSSYKLDWRDLKSISAKARWSILNKRLCSYPLESIDNRYPSEFAEIQVLGFTHLFATSNMESGYWISQIDSLCFNLKFMFSTQ